jgi:hypothetical protein
MTAVPPVSGPPAADSGDSMRWIYWVIGGLILILCVIGLITYSGEKQTQEAQQKAQQLTQKLQQAGLGVPDQDIIIRTLGNDGGNVCDNPANALGKATLVDTLVNGADFVGRRPVIVDRRILLGEALILETYCPDELQDYREKIDELKTDDTLKD